MVKNRIKDILRKSKVVLFMKGSKKQPLCGFSAVVVKILENLDVEFFSVNVLEDPEIRDGIKEFSNWPTIPQLYINGEFIGGADITKELFLSKELEAILMK